jgi:glycosyltransferase involved in cell wall biosynthesis
MSAPEVSVVIPTHDRRELLAVALTSALAQEDVELEVIVVDDASGDDTLSFLESVDDPRLTVLHQEAQAGVAAARNRGIEQARGAWVAFLDDDDRWLPRRLRTTIDCGTSAGADFVVGALAVVDEAGRRLEVWAPPPANEVAHDLRVSGTGAGPSAVIATAELLERTGGFDTQLSYLADWELWLRFAAVGRAASCEAPLVEYLQHPGSMMMDDGLDFHREFDQLQSRHPEVEIEPVFLSRWFARRYREEGRPLLASAFYVREAVTYREPGSLLRAAVVLGGERPMRVARRIRHRLLRAGVISVRNKDEEELRSRRRTQSSRS